MVLVDSNVLIDLFTNDPTWADWSEHQLLECSRSSTLVINPIIYAEVSTAFRAEKAYIQAIDLLGLQRLELPYAAGFLAAKAFLRYRKQSGAKRSLLPDFYIGAHAQVDGMKLLTRDAGRYRAYFPKVSLLTP